MIMDSQEIFSAAQAATATGDTASTNVLDTGAAHDEGVGETAWVTVQVNTTATSGGSATVQAVLQTSTDNSSWTDLLSGTQTAVASVTAGLKLLQVRIPPGAKRYLRIAYRIGTATLTAGKFDAFITKDVQINTPYASGFTVDV